MSEEAFDYVIVGAGSAGCVLADRLTADGKHSVLLLEYGGSDRSIFVQMPSALSIPMGMKKYNWFHYTEPEPHLGGRRIHTPRGKVLGGSSSINGLVYVRGNPSDFDRWEAEGAAGWNYAAVLPYFRRSETRAEGGDAYRGDAGPLQTRYGTLANPLHAAWLEAGRQAGYPSTSDINGYQQEGFGRLDMTVIGGRRCSAANAYLRPAMRRANLAVRTRALATRILFEGKRAIGVEYRRGAGLHTVRARREVIVSTGPINSPQLLKLSGIGPAAELREHGIDGRRATCLASARTCRITSNSISRWPARSPSRSIHPWVCSRARSSAHAGCSSRTASARPITSRPVASSAAARVSRTPTSSITSCRSP